MIGLTSVLTEPTANTSGLDSLAGKKTKRVNFRTLTSPVGNGADVAIPLESIRAISEQFINSAYSFFLGKRVAYLVFSFEDGLDAMLEHDVGRVSVIVKFHGVPMMAFSENGLSIIANKLGTSLMLDSYTSDMCMQSWGRSSYARTMIHLRADEELKDSIVVAMPKLIGEGFNMCTVRVEYEWKPPKCWSCNVFGHVLNECPKKIVLDVVKNLNNPMQACRGACGKKKQVEASRQEVSNSNPFDTLNSIENDDVLGTNGGNSKSARKGSLNVVHGSSSNTLIIDKINKLERQILDWKLMFVADDGNSLVLRVISDRGYDTNSLLEQWRETKQDDDYDPYNDHLYESHDMSDHLQAIYDDLDITVRGRKKK
ncbi:cytokinin dehydrogenase 3-like protein [Tanacetum coccineum]|uniref:Cytokinin dehydrogenase 3-like protein n=1 Tax=Tanacetum coccineum TaxID=301880 RepID=A0ABQ5ICD0_9ASTR